MYFIIILLIKSTILLSLTCLLLLIGRKASASLKHWMLSLTLIGLLGLPFCIHFLPHLPVEIPYYKELGLQKELTQTTTTKKDISVNRSKAASKTMPLTRIDTPQKQIAQEVESVFPTQQYFFSKFHIGTLLLLIWGVGCIIGLLQLLLGIYKIYQITITGREFKGIQLGNNNKEVSILISNEIETPMTWGFKKGVILLPNAAMYWTDETVETVLVHELAHIKRKDYWVHILSLISACFYWFHPMVWWMKKQQILEREKACDEYVLREGLSNQQYAQQLIEVARFLSAAGQTGVNYALPMANTSQLKQRIIAILQFQKERFRFTAIRQGQWATIFVSLIFLLSAFTPVEKSEVLNRFLGALPALLPPTPTPLKVDNPRMITPKAPIPISNLIVNEELTTDDKPKTDVLLSLPTSQQLLPLSTNYFLPDLSSLPGVKIKPEQSTRKGEYGVWSEKNSIFRIATYGNFRRISVFPYIAVEDSESMVIIEETKGSGKNYRLVITKAPYDGKIVQSYLNGKPNSNSGDYQKNDVVYLWTVNGEWEFLGAKKRNKWMSKRMEKVMVKLSQGVLKPANEKDKSWQELVQSQQQVKTERFVATEVLYPAEKFTAIVKPAKPAIDWEAIPYQSGTPFEPVSNWKKLGETIATRGVTANCPVGRGTKYGRVIKNMPPSILKSFNFKIRTNQHKSIEFKLHLYQLINGEVSHTILKKPIQSGKVESAKNKWVRMELSRNKIYAKGDILAVLEVDQIHGQKKNGCLSICQSIGLYDNPLEDYRMEDLGFMNHNFAFYFTTQQ